MKITVDLSALGKTKWHEYAVRFVFGGMVTVLAGLIAKNFSPGLGGLFLAFPAGATLIEKHEQQKKERAGVNGTQRGRTAAGLDAAGAAIGTVGLLCFAVVVWQLITIYQTWIVLTAATLAWLTVSSLIWYLRK
ncbi:MAG: DUF3147 family protein [Nitrospirota bacterium]